MAKTPNPPQANPSPGRNSGRTREPASPNPGREFLPLERINGSALRTRDLSQRHVATLAESIAAMGLIHPPAVDGKNRLLAGAHRLEALRWLKAHSHARFRSGSHPGGRDFRERAAPGRQPFRDPQACRSVQDRRVPLFRGRGPPQERIPSPDASAGGHRRKIGPTFPANPESTQAQMRNPPDRALPDLPGKVAQNPGRPIGQTAPWFEEADKYIFK